MSMGRLLPFLLLRLLRNLPQPLPQLFPLLSNLNLHQLPHQLSAPLLPKMQGLTLCSRRDLEAVLTQPPSSELQWELEMPMRLQLLQPTPSLSRAALLLRHQYLSSHSSKRMCPCQTQILHRSPRPCRLILHRPLHPSLRGLHARQRKQRHSPQSPQPRRFPPRQLLPILRAGKHRRSCSSNSSSRPQHQARGINILEVSLRRLLLPFPHRPQFQPPPLQCPRCLQRQRRLRPWRRKRQSKLLSLSTLRSRNSSNRRPCRG
mmetsp:Transcript_15393/g.31726  ORF Transcript_15393/g.31726 Transcript_15393/m.31726 type:complete len:261 (+) Transcript_15393:1133-1915(+)